MTGYGRDVLQIGDTTITVEIRSVNHRYLDFIIKTPRSFMFLEEKIKKVIHSFFQRGRVEVFIEIAGEHFVKKSLRTDWDLMDQYMEQVKKAMERYHLVGDIPTTMITNQLDLIVVQEVEEQPDQLQDVIIMSIERACEQVQSMQSNEGSYLIKDIKERMQQMQNMVVSLKTRRRIVTEEYRERIQQRIDEYLGDTANLDHTRIHQEIALLAEKGDITEEITRLLSHIDHFFVTMDSNDAMGRKLDFIMQEMHRETNTIGSKSMDPKISEWTIALKGDIEKIKEQVQNIA